MLLMNATLAMTYLLGRKIIGVNRWPAFAVFLLAVFYPVIVTVPQFTNQHLAGVLILASVYLLTDRGWRSWMVAGVSTAILNMVRPMGILLLLTAICHTLLSLFVPRARKAALYRIVAMSLSYAVCMSLINHAFERAGYADGPISEACVPYFKFHKGLTGYDSPEVYKFSSVEEFNRWEKARVADAISKDTGSTLAYMFTKMVRYLGGFDYKVEMTYNQDATIWNAGFIKKGVMFGWGQYIALILLALAGIWKMRNRMFTSPFFIFYIGVTLVYFFIEAFTSYRYESYPFLMIIVCSGVSGIRWAGGRRITEHNNTSLWHASR